MHIEKCIRSLLVQDRPEGGMEIIVADGMSDDGTREILQQLEDQNDELRIVDNPQKITSCGLNTAIQAASGNIIVRMDAHTDYAPDYIVSCIKIIAESKADNVGGPARTNAAGYLQKAIAAAYHSPFSVGGARFHNVEYEGPVDTVTYGCWPKSTFERFGLFDEELVRNQDDEHNLRILRGGGLVWQSPRIRSWYHPRDSLVELFRQYAQYGYWKVIVIQKHRLPASWRHLVPGGFLFTLILLGIASLFWSKALFALWWILGVYVLSNLIVSFFVALKEDWKFLPILPVVFACYHFGYGYGFLGGLIDFVLLRRGTNKKWSNLTRKTG